LVYFMLWKGRDVAAWLPADVVKENIVDAKWVITKNAECFMRCFQTDTTGLNNLVMMGSVDFGNSEVNTGTCPVYTIGVEKNKGEQLTLIIELCEDKSATLKKITSKDQDSCGCI